MTKPFRKNFLFRIPVPETLPPFLRNLSAAYSDVHYIRSFPLKEEPEQKNPDFLYGRPLAF